MTPGRPNEGQPVPVTEERAPSESPETEPSIGEITQVLIESGMAALIEDAPQKTAEACAVAVADYLEWLSRHGDAATFIDTSKPDLPSFKLPQDEQRAYLSMAKALRRPDEADFLQAVMAHILLLEHSSRTPATHSLGTNTATENDGIAYQAAFEAAAQHLAREASLP